MTIHILLIILIVLSAALIVFLFTTLKKLNRSIDVLSADVHQLIDSTIPVMNNLNKAAEKLAKVADDAENHMNDFNIMVASLKDRVNSFNERVKSSKTNNPVYNLVQNLNALSKGIGAFWNKYKT